MLIDTHTHLCDPAFDVDRQEVIKRAIAVGVDRIISVSETLADAERNLKLADVYPEILPAAGLYPTILDIEEAEKMIAFIRKHKANLVAIGEVGLDYWKVQEEADREIQSAIFRRFIDLSLELDLPLNVHSRSAGKQTIEMLLKRGAKRVQMHAFDGKASTAQSAVEAGYYFSIPPSIVRSRQKQKLVKSLPVKCLLFETDSPVLSPIPGERNEPANITVALKAVAEIKEMAVDEIKTAVEENAGNCYVAI